MRKILLIAVTLPLWAQTDPQFACAGNRAELLFYPEDARKSGLEATVIADFAVSADGAANDIKLVSTVVSIYGDTIFGPVVRMYLEQSTFPPGCQKARKQLRFEFVLRSQSGPARRPLIEFKPASTFHISVNPVAPRVETSGQLSPGQCLGSSLGLLKYPQLARVTRTQGIVKVLVQIDSVGRAAPVSIQSGPPLLRPTVKDFLEQSEFATCRGEVEIAFQFTLGNGPLETLEFLAPNLYRLTTEAAKLMVN